MNNKKYNIIEVLIYAVLLSGCAAKETSVGKMELKHSDPTKNIEAANKIPIYVYTVNGYGKLFFEANTCDLVFGIITEDTNVKDCHTNHTQCVNKVIEYVKTNTPKDTIFGIISTNLVIIPSRENKSMFYCYQTMFSLRIKPIEQLSLLQSELVQRGVNNIIKVEYLSDKQRQLEDEARKLAIEDAKHKADFIASQAGWQILGIRNIEYDDTRYERGRGSGTRYSISQDISSQATETYVDSIMKVSFEYTKKENILSGGKNTL